MEMFDTPKEERTLANYTKEAMCIIGRWGRGWMLEDNDIITNVVDAIIRAEHDFDPSRGFKRSTLRITYGRYQIISEFRKIKRLENRPHHFSIESSIRGKDGNVYKNKLGDMEDYREPFSPTIETKEHNAQQKIVVNKLLKTKALTKLQRKYLKLRYLKQMSAADMSEKFNCTKQAVNCVLQCALNNIRKELAIRKDSRLMKSCRV